MSEHTKRVEQNNPYEDADSRADTYAALALVVIAVVAAIYHVYTSGL